MTKKKRTPINTEQEAKDNPSHMIAMAAIMGEPLSIQHQEAQGQASLINSETLPIEMESSDKATLEKAGVKFGKKVVGDNLFQYVQLPAGWKKVPTNHSMWSKLVDDKGRERASIFYKAAFYDREAHLSTSRRYNINYDYDRMEKENVIVNNITDCGKIIHTTEPKPIGTRPRWTVKDEAHALGVLWLDTNFPDWRDSSAYWD